MAQMKQKRAAFSELQAEYSRLAKSLAKTGFIARGCIFERRKGAAGSHYQWSWKNPRQKTLSLTLSAEQYQWLKEALLRTKELEKTLKRMRQISHRILLEHVPGPQRRKPIAVKSLTLI